jgi:hypothetical protein
VSQPVDLEGGCACGAIRYRVRGTPWNETLCHCTDCRRASGAPALAWATFRIADLEWTKERKLRRSSDHATRGFCPDCGTQLTYQEDTQQGELDLALASLDRAEAIAPKDHTYWRSHLPWLACEDGLPRHQTLRSA